MELIETEKQLEAVPPIAPDARVQDKRLITFALMLAMSVAALEQTVVSTAMPSIIAELRGIEIYSWVTSAFLLALTVSTPLYGKLADLCGRKRVLLFGLTLFLLGSMLSGLASNMPMLIAMRVVQGLGAGAVMPIVLTILGDVFSLQERAKVQGWFSAVWGVSSLIGPILGGYLTVHVSWRWVFFITLPFGLFAMTVVALHFHERVARSRPVSIDWQGSLLLAVASTALLLVLLGGGAIPLWLRGTCLASALVGLPLFAWWETRAADPVLPPDLLRTRVVATSLTANFLLGAFLFGVELYVPLFVQGVRGGSAIDSGQRLSALLLTWSISVAFAAPAVVRFGFRRTALVGSTLIAAGAAALFLITLPSPWADPLLVASMAVMGLGMGPTMLSYVLAVQHSVAWDRRGVATGSLAFFRTIGGSLGVAILGAALTWRLAGSLPRDIDVAAALRPETHAALPSHELAMVREGLRLSLRGLYAGLVALSLVGLVCAWNLPKGDHPTAA